MPSPTISTIRSSRDSTNIRLRSLPPAKGKRKPNRVIPAMTYARFKHRMSSRIKSQCFIQPCTFFLYIVLFLLYFSRSMKSGTSWLSHRENPDVPLRSWVKPPGKTGPVRYRARRLHPRKTRCIPPPEPPHPPEYEWEQSYTALRHSAWNSFNRSISSSSFLLSIFLSFAREKFNFFYYTTLSFENQ